MTHGTLTNKTTGQTLTVEKVGNRSRGLDVRIDGCAEGNTLCTDEWDFTPDPEPLPTEPGFYASDAKGFKGNLYEHRDGRWHTRRDRSLTDDQMHYRLPLVRLVREDGKS